MAMPKLLRHLNLPGQSLKDREVSGHPGQMIDEYQHAHSHHQQTDPHLDTG